MPDVIPRSAVAEVAANVLRAGEEIRELMVEHIKGGFERGYLREELRDLASDALERRGFVPAGERARSIDTSGAIRHLHAGHGGGTASVDSAFRADYAPPPPQAGEATQANHLLALLSEEAEPEQMAALIQKVDANLSGDIEFEEFAAMFTHHTHEVEEEEDAAANMFDIPVEVGNVIEPGRATEFQV